MLTNEKAIAIALKLPPLEQIACAIYCVYPLYENSIWRTWASKWLKNEDRHVVPDQAKDEAWVGTTVISHTAWLTTLAAENLIIEEFCEVKYFTHKVLIQQTQPLVLLEVLTRYFICPHCYNQSDQHLESGKCLFSAHTWEGINNVWRP